MSSYSCKSFTEEEGKKYEGPLGPDGTMGTLFRRPIGCPVTSYYWSGFATVQALVEQSWLQWKESSHIMPSVKFQLLPKEYATSSESTIMRYLVKWARVFFCS